LDKFAAPLDVAVKKAFQLQEGEAPLTRVSDPGEGALGPHLTQCGLDRGPYLRAKFHLDPCSRLATIDMGRKMGALPPFWGGERWVRI